MPLTVRTTSRDPKAIVVESDLTTVQLLAVETIVSVSAAGSTRSMTATALFSRWSKTPAATASAAKAQPQYRGTKRTKGIANVSANKEG